MRAQFINEVNQFKRGLDPKSAMGIGRIGELERKYNVDLTVCTPNQIIILGAKERAADMIEYALELGANQLWYKITKIQYHTPIIPAPEFSATFAVITKAVSKDRWDFKIFYKDITAQLLSNYKGKLRIGTSAEFTSKYAPVDGDFMEIVKETIKNGTILKRFFENNFKQ